MNFEFNVDFISDRHSDELSAQLTHKGVFLLKINQIAERGEMDLVFYDSVLDNEVFKGSIDLISFVKQIFSMVNDLNPEFFRDRIMSDPSLWCDGNSGNQLQ